MGQVKVEIKVNGATFREFYVDSNKALSTPLSEKRAFTNIFKEDEETILDRQIIIKLGKEIIRRADSRNDD